MAISHTARHVARSNTDDLFICRQVAGRLALEQDSREVMLESGDITLIDPRLPYVGRFFEGSALIVLKVTRRLLEARVGQTRDMTARSVKPVEAEHCLTAALLAMLPKYADRLGSPTEEIVKNQVLDLVAVSLANATNGKRPRLSSARSFALMKVRAAIETRLTDPALDASTVASAAGVSVRYANDVLADYGTSIRRLIQTKRLARCRKALEDPLQRHRTVSEIAYSWGYSDMTHFGRTFRVAYGLLPSELRRLAGQR